MHHRPASVRGFFFSASTPQDSHVAFTKCRKCGDLVDAKAMRCAQCGALLDIAISKILLWLVTLTVVVGLLTSL